MNISSTIDQQESTIVHASKIPLNKVEKIFETAKTDCHHALGYYHLLLFLSLAFNKNNYMFINLNNLCDCFGIKDWLEWTSVKQNTSNHGSNFANDVSLLLRLAYFHANAEILRESDVIWMSAVLRDLTSRVRSSDLGAFSNYYLQIW